MGTVDQIFFFWCVCSMVATVMLGRDCPMGKWIWEGVIIAPMTIVFRIFVWVFGLNWLICDGDKYHRGRKINPGPSISTPPPTHFNCRSITNPKDLEEKRVISHYDVSIAMPGLAYTKGWEMYCMAQWKPEIELQPIPSHTRVEFPNERAAFEAAMMNLPMGAKYRVAVGGDRPWFRDVDEMYIRGVKDYKPLTKAQRLKLSWGTKKKKVKK